MKHIALATTAACLSIVAAVCSNGKPEERMKSNESRVVNRTQGGGRWFPGSRDELTRAVDGFLEKADVPGIEGRIVAAIAPHAGFQYSGKVAGHTFRAIRNGATGTNAPQTVVILGFTHRMPFKGVAIMDGDALDTPIGATTLDKSAAGILTRGRDRLFMNTAPHMGEHSAENEVPFVQRALPGAKLVVALIGDHDEKTLSDLVSALVELAKTSRILVVASSDMLHDPDYDLVSGTDRKTLKKVADMDHKGLMKDWSGDKQIFCGIMPALAVMRFAEAQGCKTGTVLCYRNNGDDDPSSRGTWVVGYGSAVFAVP